MQTIICITDTLERIRMDIRNAKTERAIKDALLAILAHKPLSDASVSEVAREAGISRSTFYSHFSNLEQVFNALVDEQQCGVRTLRSQLHRDACPEDDEAKPFCLRLRKAGRYAPIVREKGYLPRFLESPRANQPGDEYEQLIAEGLPTAAAQALRTFQMNGCYNAALSVHSDCEWVEIQPVIDEFIRGGIQAVRTMVSSKNRRL